jgi:hypothetical protein
VTKVSEAMAEGLVLDSIRDWIEAIDISTEDYDEYEILNEIYSGLLSKIKPFLKSIEKKYNKNLKAGSGLDLSNTKITRLPKNLKVGSKIYKDF